MIENEFEKLLDELEQTLSKKERVIKAHKFEEAAFFRDKENRLRTELVDAKFYEIRIKSERFRDFVNKESTKGKLNKTEIDNLIRCGGKEIDINWMEELFNLPKSEPTKE